MTEPWKLTKKWTMREVNKLSQKKETPNGVMFVTYDKKKIDSMSMAELADLSQYLYKQFQRRVKEARAAGVNPYGITKMYSDFAKRYDDMIDVDGKSMSLGEYLGLDLDKPITVMDKGFYQLSEPYASMRYARQQLEAYVNSMLNFFSWKSGTVAGWEKIQLEQDFRLFGGSVEGKGLYYYEKDPVTGKRTLKVNSPIKRMTESQRKAFWDAIDELRKRSSNALDYEHSEPLVNADWSILFDENLNVEWNDSTALVLTMEKIINGEELTFPEYAPTNVGNEDGATPFGEVEGLERRGGKVWE